MADEDDVDQMMSHVENEGLLDPNYGDDWMADEDYQQLDRVSTSSADGHQDEEMALDANYDGASDLRNPFNMSTLQDALDDESGHGCYHEHSQSDSDSDDDGW